MKSLLSMLIMVFLFSVPVRAELYEWTDDKGVVNFTDDRDKIPAKYLKRVKKRPSITVEKAEPAPVPAQETGEETPAVKPIVPKEKEMLYGGHDEEWWRSSYGTLRDELKGIQDKLPGKREELVQLRRRMTIYQAARYRQAYYDKLAEIEGDETKIKELNGRLEALDVDASRAGVPMDWRR